MDAAFKDAELKDVIASLREQTGCSIFMNWRALEEVGVKKDQKINLHMSGLRLKDALKAILAAAEQGSADLDYGIDGKVLVISTKENIKGRGLRK